MSSALFTAVCSIAPTRRRRFSWAAWWTAPPTKKPFRKPDAAQGGARTREEARQAAERAAGRALIEIESGWARAWANVLAGKEAWAGQRRAEQSSAPIVARATVPSMPSVWQTLGLKADATLTEIKSAYKRRALEVHPDRGGSALDFRALQSAYETAIERRTRRARKSKTR